MFYFITKRMHEHTHEDGTTHSHEDGTTHSHEDGTTHSHEGCHMLHHHESFLNIILQPRLIVCH